MGLRDKLKEDVSRVSEHGKNSLSVPTLSSPTNFFYKTRTSCFTNDFKSDKTSELFFQKSSISVSPSCRGKNARDIQN